MSRSQPWSCTPLPFLKPLMLLKCEFEYCCCCSSLEAMAVSPESCLSPRKEKVKLKESDLTQNNLLIFLPKMIFLLAKYKTKDFWVFFFWFLICLHSPSILLSFTPRQGVLCLTHPSTSGNKTPLYMQRSHAVSCSLLKSTAIQHTAFDCEF